MERLVECVPNFSDGRNPDVIKAITDAMAAVGAMVLDVDMGSAANRTVVTMAGTPDVVEEAAFAAIRVASERIDMRRHKGEHPRLGATDVCPFVPISGVTMADCIDMARRVGARVADELGIPVFLYDQAATRPDRQSLANVRAGEYEGLSARLTDPYFRPDFGMAQFNARSGATIIGAREFLVAYNVNLNTRDKVKASRIAIKLRESDGPARATDGEKFLDPNGNWLRVPGALSNIRAVGWVIEEYGIAQVSINVLDYRRTPLHTVYEEAKRLAREQGVEVTGSEIVGLLPKDALLSAGRYYLARQGLSPAEPESECIHIAVRSLGLSDVRPFVPRDKVIEYRMAGDQRGLADDSLRDFADKVSADTAVPGGGSVAALCGAMGAALSAMVGNLSARRPELAANRDRLVQLATVAQGYKADLIRAVDDDSNAFLAVMTAMKLPKGTPEEILARRTALDSANAKATAVPFGVLKTCAKVVDTAVEVAELGYRNSLSDAGVSASSALAGAEGATLNVLINLSGQQDTVATSMRASALATLSSVRTKTKTLLDHMANDLV